MAKRSVDELIEKLKYLQLETDQTLEELKQARRCEEGAIQSPPQPRRSSEFQIGDRVLITNKITHTLRGAPGSNTDRIGKVTKVTAERVFFITLAGTHTCRAPKNLSLLENPTGGLHF